MGRISAKSNQYESKATKSRKLLVADARADSIREETMRATLLPIIAIIGLGFA
jgi:hypothetical protein